MKNSRFRDKASMKKRMSLALVGLTFLFFVLSVRLAYIMIGKHAEYSAMAKEQWTSDVKIDARRGRILDRNGVELAVSANVYRVDFDLNAIRAYYKKSIENNKGYKSSAELAPLIAEAVGMETKDVQKKLDTKLPSGKDAGAATLIRRIEKQQADNLKKLIEEKKLSGIIVSPDTKRYYPNGSFLSHVLGSTNSDGKGLTGVELQYDSALSGVPGRKITELESQSGGFPYTISQFTNPVDGKDVTLTIDENIQFFAESVASQALIDHKAKAVSVLVMDPKTGEILAMVNKPDFDPNNPYDGIENFVGETDGEKLQKMWRNRLVNDTFEPGSIFKVITAITAMEEGLVSENDTFTCNGSLTYGNRRIKCWKSGGHGTQTFGEIIQNSCNVGFMQLGEKIGSETLVEYIKKFGFGQISGVDLPGEAKGIIKKAANMSITDLVTIAFGQTNTVNSVQYMAAFNTVANGGTWIQPHIMKEITHKDENGTRVMDESFEATTKKLASEENTAQLRQYLERVVTSGSGKGTFMEGYHIGGKTGTAQKVENGTYSSSKYLSTFVGMAPVDDPKVTVMVSVDEPGTGVYYAGPVCTPYAKTLFTNIFNYMEGKFSSENAVSIVKEVTVPEVRGKNIEEAKKIIKEQKLECEVVGNGSYVKSMTPFPGYAVKEGSKITLYTEGEAENLTRVIMPDIRGYSLEKASAQLGSLGLKYSVDGEGMVQSQSIPYGELIEKGTTVKLELNNEYGD